MNRVDVGAAVRVIADDRTGALETAGAMAARSGEPVRVLAWSGSAWSGPGSDGWPTDRQRSHLVLDLDTRGRSPWEAVDRVRTAVGRAQVQARATDPGRPASVAEAHKIDSTLRGNWAWEVVARHAVDGRPVLVVPALPELGRTCEGGIVCVDGTPVHLGPAGRDPRSPVRTSSPAVLLAEAGAGAGAASVVELADVGAVGRWLGDPSGFAVADATTTAQVDALASAWRAIGAEVLLAGTSSVIGAAVGPDPSVPPAPGAPDVVDRVVVLCGSLHPVAREQVRRVEQAAGLDHGRIDLVVSEEVAGSVTDHAASAASAALAAAGWARVQASIGAAVPGGRIGVVVLGGETTAAFLGDRPVDVVGWAAPGTPWGRVRTTGPVGSGELVELVVATRSGGFGGPDALVELLTALMPPARS